MKRIDVPLKNIPDLVIACICLHNLCVIHADGFDMQWANEDEQDRQNSQNAPFGNLENIDMFYIAEVAIQKIKLLQHLEINIEYIEDEEVEIDFNRGEIEGPS